jgi:thiamine biosynthesis protein ThiI
MSQNTWILRFGELGLKSKSVRGSFQKSLRKNLFQLAKNKGITIFHQIIRTQDHVSSPDSVELVEDLLSRILGVVAIDRVEKMEGEMDPESIAKLVLDNSDSFGKKRTFGVRVRRISKAGNIGSKQYEREIGSEMLRLDPTLSVNLSNPDEWIKLIIDKVAIYQIIYRIQTCAGLPPGVQGDALVQISDQKLMLEAFLIMRRGIRLIPVLDSRIELLDKLSLYDPFIGQRTLEHELSDKAFERPAWGIIGLNMEQAKPFIGKRDNAVKTTPICTLEPLIGWTENEIGNLLKHFEDPSKNILHPEISQWIG